MTSLALAKESNLIAPERGQLIKLERTMNDLYQKTYMDLNEIKKVKRDYKPMLAAIALFAMYALVSQMDYQDCIRGAVSC